jgi:hypothetical protein
MHRVLAPALFGALILAAGAPAAAKDIVRHCDGDYQMIATLTDGRPPVSRMTWSFGDYAGAGTCGATVPNRCRERARGKLLGCYREHWKVRWDRVRPEACTEAAGVSRYALADIKSAMEEQVCCSESSLKHDAIVVNLYGVTWGDEGCGANARPTLLPSWEETHRSWLIQADYEMDCSELRKQFCKQYAPKRTNP